MSNNNLYKQSDFIANSFISKVKSDESVSSSMLDSIFILGNRVPRKLVNAMKEKMQSTEMIEKSFLGEVPLIETTIDKPYWDKDYSLHVEVHNSICLAKDREVLDYIIAFGSLINEAEKYTLRQVAELGWKLKDVDWSVYNNPERIDEPLSNKGVYMYIPVNKLMIALGKSICKASREDIRKSLTRLKRMALLLTPLRDGVPETHMSEDFSIVDKTVHYILDRSKIRNNIYTPDTYTDILINIDNFYLDSLKTDGMLSRNRIELHYPYLNGANDIVDFYKFIDRNKRKFVHNKRLSKLIAAHYDGKVDSFNANRTHKLKQLYDQVVSEQPKLYKHFNLFLKRTPLSKIVEKGKVKNMVYVKYDYDYVFEYTGEDK